MIPHSKPDLGAHEFEALQQCLESGMINEGARAESLAAAFCERFGGSAAAACGSGSQALLLALKALGVGSNDEVIIPTYVCAEVLGCIEALGADARIVDVEDDWLLDVAAARAVLGPRCKAVVFPYVMGIWRDLGPLASLGLPIVEDCAQFLPDARRPLQGDLAVFSFEATKLLTSGEGGLLLARTEAHAARLPALKRFDDTPYKLNLYPLSDLLAALASVQLERMPELLSRRRSIARGYLERLHGTPGLALPESIEARSVFFRFPIRLVGPLEGQLPALIAALAERGVAARKPVDLPLSRLRAPASPCPGGDALYASTLSVPLYPALSPGEQERVVTALRDAAMRLVHG